MAAAAAAATAGGLAALDVETLALLGIGAEAAPVAVCGEWETFKENVRPLKRGRNVGLLNSALKAHADPAQRAALLAERRYGDARSRTFLFLGFGLACSGWISWSGESLRSVQCLNSSTVIFSGRREFLSPNSSLRSLPCPRSGGTGGQT
jgi:hypothetical protein